MISIGSKPWPDGFDLAYSLNVIQLIADRAECLKLAPNILGPRGMFSTTFQPRLDNDLPDRTTGMADKIKAAMLTPGLIASN
jgi:hypothetical protein